MKTLLTKQISLIFIFISACIPTTLSADDFTPSEKQEINIETPDLFAKTKSFCVDFSQLKKDEYSFPLPVGKAQVSERGLNIYTSKGDIVKAVFSGTVRLSNSLPSHGKVIVIRHDNGLETVYGGNAQNLVKSGDRVKSGQSIAVVGEKDEKGILLFEILVNGCNINPKTLIKINSHEIYRHIFKFTKSSKGVNVAIEDDEDLESDDSYKRIDKDSPVDMEREFTKQEQTIVSAQTPELFKKSSSITINFANYGKSDWSYPLLGSHVISEYGGKRRHSGVDIKTRANDSVRASFAGKVRFSKYYKGYGNVVVIRHASGLETLYAHNVKNLVNVGDWVKAGQPVGLEGRTGRATTEHCHFEIRINGRAYNPAIIFNHKDRELKKVKIVVNKYGNISVSPVK